jgi:oligopeptidase A
MKTVRQLEFSIFDFKLHMGNYQGNEIQNLLNSIRKDLVPLLPPEYNRSQNNFSHIFSGGYSAGYYSYKWAEVLSADLYLEMIDKGIFESGLNLKFRDEVLKKGGSASMSELFYKILNRQPDETKLLRLHGID